MELRQLVEELAAGRLSADEAEAYLSSFGVAEIGYHRFDQHRSGRTGAPECIYGEGKSVDQLAEIAEGLLLTGHALLATRVDEAKAAVLTRRFPQLQWDAVSRLLRAGSGSVTPGRVAVVCAGSSDVPVAEEAAGTLEYFGLQVSRSYDCGVAGLHRLFAAGDAIASADIIIVAAGMDGALPSVVAGAFRSPVIAVPTSVGYGASFDGLAALLTMLNSCAPGVTVVNIDNGFGAAIAARSMLLMAHRLGSESRPGS